MSDLISREKAVAELYKLSDNMIKAGRHQMALGVNDSIMLVGELMPTEEAKHGRWITVDYEEPRRYGCSECHRMVWQLENYCPNCGARMDGETCNNAEEKLQ